MFVCAYMYITHTHILINQSKLQYVSVCWNRRRVFFGPYFEILEPEWEKWHVRKVSWRVCLSPLIVFSDDVYVTKEIAGNFILFEQIFDETLLCLYYIVRLKFTFFSLGHLFFRCFNKFESVRAYVLLPPCGRVFLNEKSDIRVCVFMCVCMYVYVPVYTHIHGKGEKERAHIRVWIILGSAITIKRVLLLFDSRLNKQTLHVVCKIADLPMISPTESEFTPPCYCWEISTSSL